MPLHRMALSSTDHLGLPFSIIPSHFASISDLRPFPVLMSLQEFVLLLFYLSSWYPTTITTVLCTSSASTTAFLKKLGHSKDHDLLDSKAQREFLSRKVLLAKQVPVPFLAMFWVYWLLWALVSTQITFSLIYPRGHYNLFLTCNQS